MSGKFFTVHFRLIKLKNREITIPDLMTNNKTPEALNQQIENFRIT